jgi:hypothetical protein
LSAYPGFRPLLFIVLGFAAVPVGIAVSLALDLPAWAAALVAGGLALPLLLIGFRLAERAPDSPSAPSDAPMPDRTNWRELAVVVVCALVAGLATFAARALGVWVVFAVATCVCGWVVLFGGHRHVAAGLVLVLLGGGDGPEPDRRMVRFVYGFVWALVAGAAVYSQVRSNQ